MKTFREIAEMHYGSEPVNDIDKQYRENRINALEKLLTEQLSQYNVSGQLPDFLYEVEGQIRIGYNGDTVVTDQWCKWKEGNLR